MKIPGGGRCSPSSSEQEGDAAGWPKDPKTTGQRGVEAVVAGVGSRRTAGRGAGLAGEVGSKSSTSPEPVGLGLGKLWEQVTSACESSHHGVVTRWGVGRVRLWQGTIE